MIEFKLMRFSFQFRARFCTISFAVSCRSSVFGFFLWSPWARGIRIKNQGLAFARKLAAPVREREDRIAKVKRLRPDIWNAQRIELLDVSAWWRGPEPDRVETIGNTKVRRSFIARFMVILRFRSPVLAKRSSFLSSSRHHLRQMWRDS